MRRIPRLSVSTVRARVLVGIVIGVLVASVCAGLRTTHAIEGMERRAVDARTKEFLGTRPPDPRIVLAVVGKADIDALDTQGVSWPWDLMTTALAFDWMNAAGAQAVLVDVLQYDQGKGPDEVTGAKDVLEKLEVSVVEAKGLEDAFGALRDGAAIVLAMELARDAHARMDPKAEAVRMPAYEALARRLPPLDAVPEFERPRVLLPVVRLLRQASQVGYVNAPPDDDGVLRRVVPLARVGDRTVPSLPLATVLQLKVPHAVVGRRIRIGDADQRLDERGGFLANFRGRGGDYPTVRPADMVLAGNELEAWKAGGRRGPVPSVGTARPEAVRGKIVIWGINAPGVKDVVSAPVTDNFPGPEFQATTVDNLLNGDGRVPVDASTNLWILFALAAGLGAASGPTLPKGAYFGLWVVLSGGFVLGAYRLFREGVSIDLVTPVVALGATYASIVAFRLLTEGRRNKWLEGTFGQYLSPAVIEALKSDPTMLQLTGKKREITVFFSDVKSFTSISEKLPADQLTVLLNDYLTRQSEPILAGDGVIDKFIGDAVMAFFGDPVPVSDHAVRACRAAVGCRAALAGTAPLAESLGVAALKNRIGVNSGLASMGNMGSAKRLSYTAMGDTVNFASRLESANKAFGSAILIGPLTYEQAKASIVARPIARVVVVGKSEPMAIYELLGIAGETDGATLALAAAFSRAHAAVLADDLDEARRQLREATTHRPEDGPSLWFSHLIDELEAGKRRRPWDGVIVLDEK